MSNEEHEFMNFKELADSRFDAVRTGVVTLRDLILDMLAVPDWNTEELRSLDRRIGELHFHLLEAEKVPFDDRCPDVIFDLAARFECISDDCKKELDAIKHRITTKIQNE